MYFSRGDTRLYYDVEGAEWIPQGDQLVQRPVMLGLHGSLLCHSYYKPSLSGLSDSCQIIYPDFRGFGRSDLSSRDHWNFDQLASDTLGLLDHAGLEKVVILAHSMACDVAVKLALNHPDRLLGLVLLNPVFLYLPVFYQNLVERIGEEARDAAKGVFERQDMSCVEKYVELVLPLLARHPLPEAMLARGSTNLEMAVHLMPQHYERDFFEEIKQLQVRTLICSGALDPYNPPDLAERIENLNHPNIQLVSLPQASHFVLEDEPVQSLQAIRTFLNSL